MIAAVIVRPETIRSRGSLIAAAAGEWPMSAEKARSVDCLVAVEAGSSRVLGAWSVKDVRQSSAGGRTQRWVFELGAELMPERFGEEMPSLEWKVGAAWPVKTFSRHSPPPDLEWLKAENPAQDAAIEVGGAIISYQEGILYLSIPKSVEVRISIRA